jgi:hypothetical protein
MQDDKCKGKHCTGMQSATAMHDIVLDTTVEFRLERIKKGGRL